MDIDAGFTFIVVAHHFLDVSYGYSCMVHVGGESVAQRPQCEKLSFDGPFVEFIDEPALVYPVEEYLGIDVEHIVFAVLPGKVNPVAVCRARKSARNVVVSCWISVIRAFLENSRRLWRCVLSSLRERVDRQRVFWVVRHSLINGARSSLLRPAFLRLFVDTVNSLFSEITESIRHNVDLYYRGRCPDVA